jgi:hypothetical protein
VVNSPVHGKKKRARLPGPSSVRSLSGLLG